LEIKRVPMPEPVPPPSEWVIWKPWRQSQHSASLRTTSSTWWTSSAPEKIYYNNLSVIKGIAIPANTTYKCFDQRNHLSLINIVQL
jgi:hypothetical protein